MKNLEDTFLEKAVRGDPAGLGYLVKKYQNLAYTIAIRIVSNREDAEEVVQDAFVKAFASLHKFRKAAKFSTWLYRIVYNTALTKFSTRQIPMLEIRVDNEREQFATNHQHWEQIRAEERKKYLNFALSQLPAQDRLIITLHYLGELTVSEIGKITGTGKSAIKMRLLRARKQLEIELRKLLREETESLL